MACAASSARHRDVERRVSKNLLICDLTQSWSTTGGGGISTYLKEKRRYINAHTEHRLLQIVPGAEDRITVTGRTILAEVGSGLVWGSPNYRWISRNDAVFALLREYQPDIIESLCPWVLPWIAIRHRWRFPDTALVAGYRTDFPNAHVYRVMRDLAGHIPASFFRDVAYLYAWLTYNRFDRVYTLNDDAKRMLHDLGVTHTGLLGLGVDIDRFSPHHRDPAFRASLGLPETPGPLLIYAGRIDNEKRADMLVAMFKALPKDLGAAMVLMGDGKLRTQLQHEARGLPIAFPGFETDRSALARALASSDIYVSGMADETFGISVLEAQASGLPVVGVTSGAMVERVPEGSGLLGPAGDVAAMAANVTNLWRGDYQAMRANSLALANSHNRWEQTFAQLIDVEYSAALAARDVRRERWFGAAHKQAIDVS
jgi:alpha-1,6-mannosyltransferase